MSYKNFKDKTATDIVAYIVGWLIGLFISAWIVMLLWNWVAVALFALPKIGYWMAFGLWMLCHTLFRSK